MNSKIKGLGQLAITVSDVSAALEFYRDKLGLEFLFAPADNLAFLQCGEQMAAQMPDHELWMGFVKDPDGNTIGIMEEKR